MFDLLIDTPVEERQSPSGFWGEEKFVEILWRAKGEVCQISVLSAEFYRPLRYDH